MELYLAIIALEKAKADSQKELSDDENEYKHPGFPNGNTEK